MSAVLIRFLLLAFLAVLPFSLPAGAMTSLTIGTGSITGVYYLVGGAVCRLVNRERAATGFQCIVESTGGAVSNVRAIAARDLDFAIVQSDVLYGAVKGTGPFAGKPVAGLRVVMHLHEEALTVATQQGSGLNYLSDFRGHRLNVGSPGSGTYNTLDLLTRAIGIDSATFATLTEIDYASHGRALCDGEIDGFTFLVGHPSENVMAAASRCAVRLISLRPASIAALVRQYPFFRSTTIPGGLYPNNPDAIVTLGVTAQLVTRQDVDAAAVRRLIDAVLDNQAEFAGLHPALARLKPADNAYRTDFMTFHPAAAAAYRARGLLK